MRYAGTDETPPFSLYPLIRPPLSSPHYISLPYAPLSARAPDLTLMEVFGRRPRPLAPLHLFSWTPPHPYIALSATFFLLLPATRALGPSFRFFAERWCGLAISLSQDPPVIFRLSAFFLAPFPLVGAATVLQPFLPHLDNFPIGTPFSPPFFPAKGFSPRDFPLLLFFPPSALYTRVPIQSLMADIADIFSPTLLLLFSRSFPPFSRSSLFRLPPPTPFRSTSLPIYPSQPFTSISSLLFYLPPLLSSLHYTPPSIHSHPTPICSPPLYSISCLPLTRFTSYPPSPPLLFPLLAFSRSFSALPVLLTFSIPLRPSPPHHPPTHTIPALLIPPLRESSCSSSSYRRPRPPSHHRLLPCPFCSLNPSIYTSFASLFSYHPSFISYHPTHIFSASAVFISLSPSHLFLLALSTLPNVLPPTRTYYLPQTFLCFPHLLPPTPPTHARHLFTHTSALPPYP